MPDVLCAESGRACSGPEIVSALSTRVEKMAAYFGRVCGLDADDLCQEAWVAIFEMAPNLDHSIGSAEQHLLKRARWRILDTIRAQRRRQHLPLSEVHEEAVSSGYDWGEADLSELNSRLTVIQRRILRALLEGYTWREAGALMGCSSANVAYHVRRIRAQYEALVSD